MNRGPAHRRAMGLLGTGVLLLLSAAGTAAVAAGSTAARGPAEPSAAQTGILGGFEIHATAPGVAVIYTDPDPTIGAQGGTVPESTTDFSTGFGHALSAVVWPGSVVGNLGGLAGVLSIPDPVQTILKKNGNDPVRAEAFTPAGPKDSTYPPASTGQQLVMKAHADVNKVVADSKYSNLDLGAMTAGDVSAHSESLTAVSRARGDSTSIVSNVGIGGAGPATLVHIDSVTSTAHVETDGSHGKSSGTTTVTGLTVAGVPASLDDKGLHFGAGPPSLVGQTVAGAVDSIVRSTGLTVVLAAPSSTTSGARASYVAGAVVVQFSQSGRLFTVTLGGASARVNGTPALPDAGSLPVDAPSPGAPPALSGSGPPSSSVGGGSTGPPRPDSSGSGAAIGAPGGALTDTGGVPASSHSPFRHVPGAAIVLGILGAFAVAGGIWRLPTNILAERIAGTACPLEEAS